MLGRRPASDPPATARRRLQIASAEASRPASSACDAERRSVASTPRPSASGRDAREARRAGPGRRPRRPGSPVPSGGGEARGRARPRSCPAAACGRGRRPWPCSRAGRRPRPPAADRRAARARRHVGVPPLEAAVLGRREQRDVVLRRPGVAPVAEQRAQRPAPPARRGTRASSGRRCRRSRARRAGRAPRSARWRRAPTRPCRPAASPPGRR